MLLLFAAAALPLSALSLEFAPRALTARGVTPRGAVAIFGISYGPTPTSPPLLYRVRDRAVYVSMVQSHDGRPREYDFGADLDDEHSQTTEFHVEVASACGYVLSEVARVAVNDCPASETGPIRAVVQADGSWVLTPDPIARPDATYSWATRMFETIHSTRTILPERPTDTLGSASGKSYGSSPWVRTSPASKPWLG